MPTPAFVTMSVKLKGTWLTDASFAAEIASYSNWKRKALTTTATKSTTSFNTWITFIDCITRSRHAWTVSSQKPSS